MEKKKQPVVTMGTSSILVIFIILCLVTFALLSLASAKADHTYASKIAERTSEYYAACNAGEELLSQIQLALSEVPAERAETYYQEAGEALERIEGIQVDSDSASRVPVITFQLPVNEDFILDCELEAVFPQQLSDPLYRITKWKEASQKEWNPDESMNLLDPEGE